MAGEIYLPEEQYRNLINAEQQALNLLSQYDKMTECGIDCQQLRAGNQQTLQIIANLKKNFPPPGWKK